MISNIHLPEYNEIRAYESISNKEGSGISPENILGNWRFQHVWKKGKNKIDNISSSLLQILSANLEVSKLAFQDEVPNYKIKNSINFGIISILFIGKGFLKSKRPILYFYFEGFYLKLGGLNLISKKLNKTDFKNMPFFSLIRIDKNKKWMCARGKGGGLAIWIKT